MEFEHLPLDIQRDIIVSKLHPKDVCSLSETNKEFCILTSKIRYDHKRMYYGYDILPKDFVFNWYDANEVDIRMCGRDYDSEDSSSRWITPKYRLEFNYDEEFGPRVYFCTVDNTIEISLWEHLNMDTFVNSSGHDRTGLYNRIKELYQTLKDVGRHGIIDILVHNHSSGLTTLDLETHQPHYIEKRYNVWTFE